MLAHGSLVDESTTDRWIGGGGFNARTRTNLSILNH